MNKKYIYGLKTGYSIFIKYLLIFLVLVNWIHFYLLFKALNQTIDLIVNETKLIKEKISICFSK